VRSYLKNNLSQKGLEYDQVVKHLPSKHKSLRSNSCMAKKKKNGNARTGTSTLEITSSSPAFLPLSAYLYCHSVDEVSVITLHIIESWTDGSQQSGDRVNSSVSWRLSQAADRQFM
jgi:hypothetical protein